MSATELGDAGSHDEHRCWSCGGRIDPGDWNPAATTTDENGELQVLVFCSKECRTEYRLTDDTS